ncbi:MAG: hypothetical protein K9I69_07820 [Ignavibacteriales bacterium]|nr:hypothetical protein [Ignavibacteriales bacterium]MCF8305436.1 hypothetical protein [Ignavibacteriales bacterium]MCF8316119.1 hypothetical protein [Ignavibacteriales bacterium]MCF8436621.1 hypothetical protein [Ignavibacteriales bacterium]
MKKVLFGLFLFISSGIVAQEKTGETLSGNLALDSKIAFDQTYSPNGLDAEGFERKSPLIAGLLSFAVPGAGEFYSGSYIKSAIFFAVEVAAIATGLAYDSKGDDQTDFFEGFADTHWKAYLYARWTEANLQTLNANLDPADYPGLFYDNERTRVNWAVLNRMEDDIGGYYSHRLAPYGDQQYYEMIGKYSQFNPGWDDFGDETTPFVYGNPVTPRFTYYTGERAKANDYYSIAKTAVIIVVTNHILSTFDAAWTAMRHNRAVEMGVDLKRKNIGYDFVYYPQFNLKINF